ncbi:MAG: adenylate kinase [Gemmatimonadales bacterium]
MFILFLGPPGSGKGTQAKILSKRLGKPQIATGEILRAAVAQGTPLGQKVKEHMDKGQLVPDDVILDLIKDVLDRPDAKDGAIFDGFPRTVAQAQQVDRLLAGRGQRLTHVLLFDVPEEELVRRMHHRATVEGRTDDTPDAIRKRLEVYRQQTAPLVALYAQRGTVHRVEATGSVEAVAEQVKRIVGH